MKDFGLAAVKKEGEAVQFDKDGPETPRILQPTYYFEQAFTKAEFALLAEALAESNALHSVPHPLLVELQEEFAHRAVSGDWSGYV